LLYDQSGNNDAGSYEIDEFPATAGIPQAANITQIHAGDALHLYVNALNSPDINSYSNLTGLAVDPSGNIYVADAFTLSGATSVDGGHVYKLTRAGSLYKASTYTTGLYTSALASDASGNIYACNGSAGSKAYSVVEYPGGSTAAPQTLYTGLTAGGPEYFLPTAIAPVTSTNVFVNNGTTGGTDQGDLDELFGPPATQASGISFSNIEISSTNISWTNGTGTGEMVFVEAGTAGTPTITNGTTYSANPQFGSGSTAGSGWYCVYNGPGTSVTVNGLQPETAYSVMVAEQNGQNYLTTAVQGSNINNFTTESYTIVPNSTPAALTSIAGNAVPVTSFNFTCTNINILVADAPAGFDISFDNLNWSVQGGQIEEGLGIIPFGSSLIVNGTIYVRLDAADNPGNYSGNVILKDGAGVLTVNVAVPLSTVLANAPTTVNSITAANAYSNAGTMLYAVTFGSTVIGLTPANFSLTTTGMVSGASVASVSGSGSSYTVTVNTGTGDGSIGLNLDNNTGFAPTISTGLPFAGGTTVIDKTPPTISISSPSVSSIVPGSGQVTYTVTYADANFNTSTLSTSDITLNTNGKVNGAVTLTGSGTSYTVTISNIAGNGTLGISIDAGTATDLAGNAAPASDPSVTFVVSQPVISAMGKLSPLSAVLGSASPSEKFNVSGSNLSGDITVTAPVGFDVSPDNSTWSGSGGSYLITPSSGAISATVFVRLDASDIVNTYSGNVALTGGGASEADMLIPPSAVSLPNTTVSSITYNGVNPTGASDLYYTLTFAAPVTGLTVNNFTISTTGTVGGNIGSVTGSGITYTIEVGSISGIGTLTLNLDNENGLTPGLDTSLPYSAPTVTINSAVAPPASLSITGMPVPLSTPSGTASVSTSINVSGSNLTGNVTVTVPSGFDASADNSTWSGSGGSFMITPVSGSISSIPAYIRLDAGDAPNSYSGEVIITGGGASQAILPLPASMVFPGMPSNTVTSITPASAYTNGSTVQYTVTFGTQVMGLNPGNFLLATTGSVSGASVTSINGMGSSYTVAVNTGTGDGTIGLTLYNTMGMMPFITNIPFAGGIATIDKTPPTATISAPAVALIGGGTSGTVSYTVTYADANFNTSNLANSGITLNKSGTANGTIGITGSGTSYTVTISNITGLGTLGISVGAGFANDLAGNTDAGAGPSATFNVVSSDALLANFTISNGNLSPAFSSGTFTYTDAIANLTSSITVVPTSDDPNATITVNGNPATSGLRTSSIPMSVGANTLTIVVTAADGVTTQAYTITVNRSLPGNALLSSITLAPPATLVGATGPGNYNFTAAVANSVSSIRETPTAQDGLATITVNGSAVVSGSLSQSIPLNIGANTITTVVTAEDGSTTKTYIVTVNRALPNVATLSNLTISSGTLSPAFAGSTLSYTASVAYPASTITLTPTTTDPNATVTVNGKPAASPIALSVGLNKIVTKVTAQNGTTFQNYTTYITRAAASTNALYTSIALSPVSTLVGATGPGYLNFKTNVAYDESSVQVVATAKDPTATITVNGSFVTSGSPSQAIALNVGSNIITTVITAQNGVTTKTAIITVNRAAPPVVNNVYEPISVTKQTGQVTLEDGITVHQAVSPNGDGINDYLTIDGITSYPDNNLMIIDRNGVMVYQAKGYDNSSKLFDGHSSINGKMQLPGTYFYSLDYTVNGENKHKTGYIILKY